MKDPYLQLSVEGRPGLAEMGWKTLEHHVHGDLPRWLKAIADLPEGDGFSRLDLNRPVLGRPVQDLQPILLTLKQLHPWRKGPIELGGVKIDTEWRSDLKWQRLEKHLDLDGHEILDIGCGNGYFGLRMLAAGARTVVGIDPTMVFVMQWLAMQKLAPGFKSFVLPLGIEDLPEDTACFDSVFSMGVLYHRRQPLEHLEHLKKLTRSGGQIILETLILEDDTEDVLKPQGRYARMRNVHAIPTLKTLTGWLLKAGLPDVQVLDVSRTTTDEQRSTEWMTFESLKECLSEGIPSLTIEGHPAPVRAALLITP